MYSVVTHHWLEEQYHTVKSRDKLVSVFIEASRTVKSNFFMIKMLKNLKPSVHLQKVLIWFLGPSKKLFI
jgi:hypothetical protein